MNKELYQLLGDGIEELWEFPSDLSIEEIKEAWGNYEKSDYESFEEYIDNFNPQLGGVRQFVTEIYV